MRRYRFIRRRLLAVLGMTAMVVAWQPSAFSDAGAGRAISTFGTYVHAGSGFRLPAVVAGINRHELVALDSAETNVTARYHETNSQGYLTVSVSIFRASADNTQDAESCRRQFDQTVLEVASSASEPRTVANESVAPRFGAIGGHHAILVSNMEKWEETLNMSEELDIRTELYLYCNIDRRWMLKYEITYFAGADLQSRIAALMNAVPAR